MFVTLDIQFHVAIFALADVLVEEVIEPPYAYFTGRYVGSGGSGCDGD